MSRISEKYYDEIEKRVISKVEYKSPTREEINNLSEKEKCLYYGIPCSFGICSECNNN